MMKVRARWTTRAGTLALLGLLLPACSSSTTSTSTQLLADGFNGGFPGTTWTMATLTGSATAGISSTTGFPAPSLEMTATAASSSAQTATILAFRNPSLTISVAMADLSATPSTDTGTGTVSILDSTMTAVATATWVTTSSGGTLTFHIKGGTADVPVAVNDDGTFHRVFFSVNSSGVASWDIDLGGPLVTASAFPGGNLTVELSASFPGGTTWPKFFFDNVDITSP